VIQYGIKYGIPTCTVSLSFLCLFLCPVLQVDPLTSDGYSLHPSRSSREELAQLEDTMRTQRSISSVYIDPATRALAGKVLRLYCTATKWW